MDEWTALGHRPFVSGVMTAEVISVFFGTKGGGMGGYFLDKEGGVQTMKFR
jgi:hypothetical protein